MPDPTTKAELLDEMHKGYAAFEALLAPLDAEQLTAPGVNGAWSNKDILAHVAIWQARSALILEAAARNEEPRLDPPITNQEEIDRFNDGAFAANKKLPLEQVWSDFRASYQRLRTAVEALSEGELFDPQRFAWREGEALWTNVGGNTFWHYQEHTPVIEVWLARQGA